MEKKQAGFTLIELVVVIVILGILAATAIPRFENLTNQANDAVASGIVGAIVSSAVIEYGSASASGTAGAAWDDIIERTVVSNVDTTPTVVCDTGCDATTACDIGAAGCVVVCTATQAQTFTVTVNQRTAVGAIPEGLCTG